MKESPNRSYYGSLDGVRYGDPFGVFVIDEAFQRILDKHEEKLVVIQGKLIKTLKNTFSNEIKGFNKKLDVINKKLSTLEKDKEKEKSKETEIKS